MDEQQPSGATTLEVQTLKRKGLSALMVFMVLLVIVILLTASDKVPPFLTLLTLVAGIYALRAFWQARQAEQGK